jgi:uncharacterized protein YggE
MRKSVSSRLLTVAAILALFATTAIPQPAWAAEGDAPASAITGTVLDINAQAQAGAAPDMATISAGVMTQADTAAAAMQDNARKMSAVFATLKKLKIADKDIQTASISVTPQYTYDNSSMGERHPPRISGYQAGNTLSLSLHGDQLKNIGPVLDALAAAGANNINGPNFGIEDTDPLLDKARAAAVEKAQKRAELYAKATGLHVKRIISISEEAQNNYIPPRPLMMKAMSAAAPAAPTPVAQGEVDVSINLAVTYELSK